MEALVPNASATAERLTWDQICSRFPDEWVVLAETDWTNGWGPEFGTAVVVAHYKRRKEASPYIKAAFERYPQIGCFWTGALREPLPRLVFP